MVWSTLKGRSAPLFYALAASLLLTHTAAQAQWNVAVETGLRQTKTAEFDPAGRRLVDEHGWLPGIGLQAQLHLRDWTLGMAAETWRGDIDYDGSLQSGGAFSSRTATRQERIRLEATRSLTANTSLIGGIEYDCWRRGIQAQGNIAGLDESYASWRLLAGAQTALLTTPALHIAGKAQLVLADAERVHVRFDKGLFDDANLRTKPATGLRLGLTVQPAAWPGISLLVDLDWLRMRRSRDETLYRANRPAGIVAQPEHERRLLQARLQYRF